MSDGEIYIGKVHAIERYDDDEFQNQENSISWKINGNNNKYDHNDDNKSRR